MSHVHSSEAAVIEAFTTMFIEDPLLAIILAGIWLIFLYYVVKVVAISFVRIMNANPFATPEYCDKCACSVPSCRECGPDEQCYEHRTPEEWDDYYNRDDKTEDTTWSRPTVSERLELFRTRQSTERTRAS